jgi:16S rRNA G527 N7-methylase RsmG
VLLLCPGELCLPFVKPDGVWVAAKGANPQASAASSTQIPARFPFELCAFAVLSELCLPFVKPGGVWVTRRAAKGTNPQASAAVL